MRSFQSSNKYFKNRYLDQQLCLMLDQKSKNMKNVKSVAEHIDSIKQFTFQQRFYKWESYVKTLQLSQSHYYQTALQKFVEYYPFNFTYWIQLCQLLLKMPKGKANALKMYQVALTKNSRCISLWKHYLQWLNKQISKSDPNYLKNQYEKATKIIGTHYGAAFIFEEYFQLEKNIIKKYQTMKKALVSPLGQIDKIFDIIVTFIDSSENLTPQLLDIIAKQQNLQLASEKGKSAIEYYSEIKQKIKANLRKLYEPTKKHVQMRYQYQSNSKLSLDEYQPYKGSIELWRNYLHFIKNSGNIQLVYPLYERALISLCDSEALWEDYFLILQGQGNYNRALYLLRSHSTFFQNLSRQITYYWLQIEERESPEKARDLYVQLQKHQYNLEAFIRHIQLQLRSKQYSHAKTIYETILTIFTSNLNIIAYVVVEYAQFSLKYFRDIQFSKKLLKNYFQSYPYNQYLLINYLQFYIRNIEYKEGSKDSKEVFDQFMNLVSIGLKRCLQNTPQRYDLVSKVAKKCIRNYISSIYLVKAAQRKIKQIQISVKRQKDSQNNLKRSLNNATFE